MCKWQFRLSIIFIIYTVRLIVYTTLYFLWEMCTEVRIRIFRLNTFLYLHMFAAQCSICICSRYIYICIYLFAQHPFLCQVAMHKLGKRTMPSSYQYRSTWICQSWYVLALLCTCHLYMISIYLHIFWGGRSKRLSNKYCKARTFKTFGEVSFMLKVATWEAL